METNTQGQLATQRAKKKFSLFHKIRKMGKKNIMTGLLVFMGLWLVGACISTVLTKASTAKTPMAQERYNALLFQLCEEGLKPLASAKIDDKRAGFLEEAVDLNDLAYKESVDCSTVGANLVFSQPQ